MSEEIGEDERVVTLRPSTGDVNVEPAAPLIGLAINVGAVDGRVVGDGAGEHALRNVAKIGLALFWEERSDNGDSSRLNDSLSRSRGRAGTGGKGARGGVEGGRKRERGKSE